MKTITNIDNLLNDKSIKSLVEKDIKDSFVKQQFHKCIKQLKLKDDAKIVRLNAKASYLNKLLSPKSNKSLLNFDQAIMIFNYQHSVYHIYPISYTDSKYMNRSRFYIPQIKTLDIPTFDVDVDYLDQLIKEEYLNNYNHSHWEFACINDTILYYKVKSNTTTWDYDLFKKVNMPWTRLQHLLLEKVMSTLQITYQNNLFQINTIIGNIKPVKVLIKNDTIIPNQLIVNALENESYDHFQFTEQIEYEIKQLCMEYLLKLNLIHKKHKIHVYGSYDDALGNLEEFYKLNKPALNKIIQISKDLLTNYQTEYQNNYQIVTENNNYNMDFNIDDLDNLNEIANILGTGNTRYFAVNDGILKLKGKSKIDNINRYSY